MIDELNRLSAEYLNKDELERNLEFCNDLKSQQKRLQDSLAAYQKKIGEYAKGIQDLYMDKVKGIVSEQDYVDMSASFSAEKDRLQQLVEHTQHRQGLRGLLDFKFKKHPRYNLPEKRLRMVEEQVRTRARKLLA